MQDMDASWPYGLKARWHLAVRPEMTVRTVALPNFATRWRQSTPVDSTISTLPSPTIRASASHRPRSLLTTNRHIHLNLNYNLITFTMTPRTTIASPNEWRSPAPTASSRSRSTSETPHTEMTDTGDLVDHLTRLVQGCPSRASNSSHPSQVSSGKITNLAGLDDLHRVGTSYGATPTQTKLKRRLARTAAPSHLPALAISNDSGTMSAVGEHAPSADVFDDSSALKLAMARTFTSLLSAHEYSGAFLAWASSGPRSARVIRLEAQSIALECDSLFLAANPRSVSASEFLSKDYQPPGDESRLTNFLRLALDLLCSSPGRIAPSPPALMARLLATPQPSAPNPLTSIPASSQPKPHGRRLRRSPGTPPRPSAPSPPRMAINDLSTPPRSMSPTKRSSPAHASPPKRAAIDVHAWRNGLSGAALFDRCSPERCCSPTELDTPPPSNGQQAEEEADATLRPGVLQLAADTARPGVISLQPAWEEKRSMFAPRPLASTATIVTRRKLGASVESRAPMEPSIEDYLDVLADLRLMLVSSAEMDGMVEDIRLSLSF